MAQTNSAKSRICCSTGDDSAAQQLVIHGTQTEEAIRVYTL